MSESAITKCEYYKGLNGIRTIAALCIIAMHVYANRYFTFKNVLTENVKHYFADFVFLFMIVSGFSICCGYYEKFKNQRISLNDFYLKRYKRIWPFFITLTIIDLIVSRQFSLVYEGIANATLLFGFLPDPKLEVIGVGWFLGVVFAFYIFFPFFIFAFWDKKRAWFSLVITFIFSILCSVYFFRGEKVGVSFDPRTNFLYCMIYFSLGVLLYLYKDLLIKITVAGKIVLIVLSTFGSIIFFIRPSILNNYDGLLILLRIVTFVPITVIGITCSNSILDNKFTGFISSVSMQIYLCHMVAFRVLEGLHLFELLRFGWISYIIGVVLVIVLAIVIQYIIERIFVGISKVVPFISKGLMKGGKQ